MNTLSKISKTNQSRKVKNKIDKKKIWKQFENDIGKKSNLELLFEEDRKGNRESCELCQSQLYVSDEKFLVCSNENCGVIYKDCLDATA